MSGRMRSISAGSLSFCTAASVGSHTAPLSASTQRSVVAASRMSHPAELAHSCSRSQPMLGLCGIELAGARREIHGGVAAAAGSRSHFRARRDEAQRGRGRERARVAVASQRLRRGGPPGGILAPHPARPSTRGSRRRAPAPSASTSAPGPASLASSWSGVRMRTYGILARVLAVRPAVIASRMASSTDMSSGWMSSRGR